MYFVYLFNTGNITYVPHFLPNIYNQYKVMQGNKLVENVCNMVNILINKCTLREAINWVTFT